MHSPLRSSPTNVPQPPRLPPSPSPPTIAPRAAPIRSRAPQRTRNVRAYAAASGNGAGKRITQNEFTEKAWQAIVAAPEIATQSSQQIVETEHLLKALLEQPNGLARRIVAKAGGDPSRLLDKVDGNIRSQPRVSGDAAQQVGLRLAGWVAALFEATAV